MEIMESFFTIMIPLLIIMDPLENLPFFLLFTEKNSPSEKKKMAAIASMTACAILSLFCLTGNFVLRFFGIGLSAFQLAGGFIFLVYALQMRHLIPSGLKATSEEETEGRLSSCGRDRVLKRSKASFHTFSAVKCDLGRDLLVLCSGWRATPDH